MTKNVLLQLNLNPSYKFSANVSWERRRKSSLINVQWCCFVFTYRVALFNQLIHPSKWECIFSSCPEGLPIPSTLLQSNNVVVIGAYQYYGCQVSRVSFVFYNLYCLTVFIVLPSKVLEPTKPTLNHLQHKSLEVHVQPARNEKSPQKNLFGGAP